MNLEKMSDAELRKIAGWDEPQSKKEPSLRERLEFKPEDFTKATKLIFGEIKRHEKPKEGASLRERLEIKPEDYNLAVRNIASTSPIVAVKGVSQLGKIAAGIPGRVADTVRSIADSSRLAKLKFSPELKAKVLEKLGKEAGGHKIAQVSNAEAGELARKAADFYKGKHQKVSAAAYKKPTEALERYTEGHTNEKKLTPISNVLEPLVQHFHSLEEPAAKAAFLSTAPGKQMIKALGGVQDVKVPHGQKASIVQKVEHLLSDADVVQGRVMPIKTAEALKQDLGDLLKNKELFGTSQEKKISNAYHAAKESIGNKYEEAGAKKAWDVANKIVSEHHQKKAPIANRIASHGPTEPVSTFKDVHGGLKEDALAHKFVSQHLQVPDRQIFHRGTIFELGKKGNAFDPATFNKNFADLPNETKSKILRHLSPDDKNNVGSLIKRLRTLGELEIKKGTKEIAAEFLPNWLQKITINPIKKVRHNAYLKPKNVAKTTEALKRKAHPIMKGKHEFDVSSIPGISKTSVSSKHNDLEHLSNDELMKIAGWDREHHMDGGRIKGGREHHMEGKRSGDSSSDESNNMEVLMGFGGFGSSKGKSQKNKTVVNHSIDSSPKSISSSSSILSDEFKKHHLFPAGNNFSEKDMKDYARAMFDQRNKKKPLDTNTMLDMNPYARKRFIKSLKTPEMQERIATGKSRRTLEPVNISMVEIFKRLPSLAHLSPKVKSKHIGPDFRTIKVSSDLKHVDHKGRPKINHYQGRGHLYDDPEGNGKISDNK